MKTCRAGFTLVELLVSTTVLILLGVVLAGVTSQTAATWRFSEAKAEQFREARRAYETVTRRLSQATLNTYWTYLYPLDSKGNPDPTKPPTSYVRQSDLRFRSGRMSALLPGGTNQAYHPTHGVFFQATFGTTDDPSYRPTDDLLNAWGYYVELADDSDHEPPFLNTGSLAGKSYSGLRYRLMEFRQSTENLTIYNLDPNKTDDSWFTKPLEGPTASRPVRVMARNIVALIILPKLSAEDQASRNADPLTPLQYRLLSPTYDYDSKLASNYLPPPKPPDPQIDPKNQLPPVVQVGMVAIDEASARKLAAAKPVKFDLGLRTTDLFQRANNLESGAASGQEKDGDLAVFEQRLIAARVSYRFYVSNVALRGAKWSASDTN